MFGCPVADEFPWVLVHQCVSVCRVGIGSVDIPEEGRIVS